MFGNKLHKDRGILVRFIETLFTKINNDYEISIAAFQIYQNSLYDLLDNKTTKTHISGNQKGKI